MKKYIEDSINNENNIEYIGEVKDVREIWKISHIAILPSKREGLPKSLLEAAAAGKSYYINRCSRQQRNSYKFY